MTVFKSWTGQNRKIKIFFKPSTVKPVYNDHPRDPKIVAVVDRWSLAQI